MLSRIADMISGRSRFLMAAAFALTILYMVAKSGSIQSYGNLSVLNPFSSNAQPVEVPSTLLEADGTQPIPTRFILSPSPSYAKSIETSSRTFGSDSMETGSTDSFGISELTRSPLPTGVGQLLTATVQSGSAFSTIIEYTRSAVLTEPTDYKEPWGASDQTKASGAIDEVPTHILSAEIANSTRITKPKVTHLPAAEDYMPLAEATQFCKNRHWNVWKDRSKSRRIYDLVFVHSEIEALELRLGQLYNQVDYFIIVESSQNFDDVSKRLLVKENWARFKPYHDKMIRHTLRYGAAAPQSFYEHEVFARNAMYNQALFNLNGTESIELGDVILVSDVNEIPKPSALVALRNCDFPRKLTLHAAPHAYSYRFLQRGGDWPHPQATYFDAWDTVPLQHLRETADAHLYNAAWYCFHCVSTMMELILKINETGLSDADKVRWAEPHSLLNRVKNGIDFYENADTMYDYVEDECEVPGFVLKNPEKFKYMLDRTPPNANFKDVEA